VLVFVLTSVLVPAPLLVPALLRALAMASAQL